MWEEEKKHILIGSEKRFFLVLNGMKERKGKGNEIKDIEKEKYK